MDEVWVQIGRADFVEKEGVRDGIERLRDVDSHGGCTQRWFGFIEARGNTGGRGHESSDRGMTRPKTMLGGRRRKGRREKRKNTPFEDLRSWAEKGNGTIRGRDRGRFTRFRDREDEGLLPDRREF